MELLVLSGGQHPYGESTPVLETFLKAAGHAVEVTEDAGVLTSGRIGDVDCVVFNTRREGDLTLPESERTALTQFVGGGKAFVCIHISGCRPEAWPEYHDVTGAAGSPAPAFIRRTARSPSTSRTPAIHARRISRTS